MVQSHYLTWIYHGQPVLMIISLPEGPQHELALGFEVSDLGIGGIRLNTPGW
jgi:hypothetical protein